MFQVNTLQQVHNIGSYGMMRGKINKGAVQIHAMWLDIYTGDFYLFSKAEKRFVVITEDNYDRLLKEALGKMGYDEL